MEQFDKVCKGMECCVLRDPDAHRRCGECPYNPHAISNEPCANGLMFNAIALIRQQQKRIKELEAAQQWISVKDRLPERPDNWPKCEIRRCYYLVALESGCVKSLGFEFGDMRWHATGSPVTHWMQLPEPQKEEP